MKITHITPRFFSDFHHPPLGNLDGMSDVHERSAAQPGYAENAYSFTCLKYHAGRIYCGTTNFAGNILHAYDVKSHSFTSLGFAAWGRDRHEIKIHRSLALGADGRLYGAASALHGFNRYQDAPGSKLFAYDPAAGTYENFGIPVPHEYIQTISLDPARGLIYGFTLHLFIFFVFDLKSRRVVYQQPMGSIPHLSAIDDRGGYWGTWDENHFLFRYDPATNAVKFFNHGLPNRCQSLMYTNAGPIDMALNAGNGEFFIGSELGELLLLDTETARTTYLGKPFPTPRLPGICLGPDGTLILAGGRDDSVRIAAYDRARRSFTDLGEVRDPASGAICFRPHDIICVGDTAYLGETDNPKRSSYLWEIGLAR